MSLPLSCTVRFKVRFLYLFEIKLKLVSNWLISLLVALVLNWHLLTVIQLNAHYAISKRNINKDRPLGMQTSRTVKQDSQWSKTVCPSVGQAGQSVSKSISLLNYKKFYYTNCAMLASVIFHRAVRILYVIWTSF